MLDESGECLAMEGGEEVRRHYYNLGQWTGHRVCYFRSTDVEQMNYHRLLWSVPDEMLYFLSCGDKIVIHEKSKKRAGKIERVFIPVLSDFFNTIYLNESPKHKQLRQHYEKCVEEYKSDSALCKKYAFWKRKICGPINISCKTVIVRREPNKIYKEEKK